MPDATQVITLALQAIALSLTARYARRARADRRHAREAAATARRARDEAKQSAAEALENTPVILPYIRSTQGD